MDKSEQKLNSALSSTHTTKPIPTIIAHHHDDGDTDTMIPTTKEVTQKSMMLVSNVVADKIRERERDDETFLTQRGGKIIEKTDRVKIPVVGIEKLSKFEPKRTLQSTLLLQRKKEMLEVQKELESKRIEFSKRMEECKEKQDELKAKQKQLRERVNKFEKFLKENDAKRTRANLKASTERKLREAKESELATLTRTLASESAKYERMSQLTKHYKVYEDFLQSVVDSLPPNYLDTSEPHINDIVLRHRTLVETNKDLMNALHSTQETIENNQLKLTGLMKERDDMIFGYNSQLGAKQKKLDMLKQKCLSLESHIEEKYASGKERMRVLGETKLAINNLFERVAIRSRIHRNNNNNQQIQNQNQNQKEKEKEQKDKPEKEKETKEPNAATTTTTNKPKQHTPPHDTEKSIAQKLSVIGSRLMDLQLVASKAEEFIRAEQIQLKREQRNNNNNLTL